MSEPEAGLISEVKSKHVIIYFSCCLFLIVLLHFLNFSREQVIAVGIFFLIILGTIMFCRFRLAIAFCGVSLLLLTNIAKPEELITSMSLDLILFLIGMMILVALLSRAGLFRWLIIKMVKLTDFNPVKLLIVFIFLSVLMAALVDEVTSILFILAMIFELCEYFEINPLPFIITSVFATNIGSAATVLGNPIGILIALRSGLTFGEFLRWSMPICILSAVVITFILIWFYRKEFTEIRRKMRDFKDMPSTISKPPIFTDASLAVKDKKKFVIAIALFLAVIMCIATQSTSEHILGLERGTILIAIPLLAAGLVLLIERHEAKDIVEKHVDWWTLLFFMFLFGAVAGLEHTGITDKIAAFVTMISGDSYNRLVSTIMVTTALTSGFMDNIPVIATFIPIVHQLKETGVYAYPLWWSLLFGGAFGGNLTIIGSTANIVTLGMLEKRGYHISFIKWMKIGVIIVAATIALSALLLILQIPLMPK